MTVAKTTAQKQEKSRNRERGDAPEAGSVDREPNPDPTKQDIEDPVSPEDEPRGAPTSDRFHTEQVHRKSRDKG